MNLENLYLRSFRNYGEVRLTFEPGVNLIVGDNAQGKTNLLEAISYLGSGKSFRAMKTSEMVRFGDDFAEIKGKVFDQERSQELRYYQNDPSGSGFSDPESGGIPPEPRRNWVEARITPDHRTVCAGRNPF